jgi:hypothetical protein
MVDRVKLRLPSTGATFTAYIHYGKIQKICTFCGVMFHEVAECALRRQVIVRMQANGESTRDVPFDVLGGWMTQERLLRSCRRKLWWTENSSSSMRSHW